MAMTATALNISAPTEVTLNSVVYKKYEISTGKAGGIHLYVDYEKGTEDGLDMFALPESEAVGEPCTNALFSTASNPVSLDAAQYFTFRADTAWPIRTAGSVFSKFRKLWIELNPNENVLYVFFKVAGSATWETGTGKLRLAAVPNSR